MTSTNSLVLRAAQHPVCTQSVSGHAVQGCAQEVVECTASGMYMRCTGRALRGALGQPRQELLLARRLLDLENTTPEDQTPTDLSSWLSHCKTLFRHLADFKLSALKVNACHMRVNSLPLGCPENKDRSILNLIVGQT